MSLPTDRSASFTDETENQSTIQCPSGQVLVGIEFNEESPFIKKVTRIKCASVDENQSNVGEMFRGDFVDVNHGVDGGEPRLLECPAGTIAESLLSLKIGGVTPNLVAAEPMLLCRNVCTGELAGSGNVTTGHLNASSSRRLHGSGINIGSSSSSRLHGSGINIGFNVPRFSAPQIPSIPSVQEIPRVPGVNFNSVPVLNLVPEIIDGTGDLSVGALNFAVAAGSEAAMAITHPEDTITHPLDTVATVASGGQVRTINDAGAATTNTFRRTTGIGAQPQQRSLPEPTFDQMRVGCPTGPIDANAEAMDTSGNTPGITGITVAHGDEGVTNISFGCRSIRAQQGNLSCRDPSASGTGTGGGDAGGVGGASGVGGVGGAGGNGQIVLPGNSVSLGQANGTNNGTSSASTGGVSSGQTSNSANGGGSSTKKDNTGVIVGAVVAVVVIILLIIVAVVVYKRKNSAAPASPAQ